MCIGTQAWPLSVVYTAVDLADGVSGADRWRYDYTLSGDLGEFEGVNLLFAYGTYQALQVVTAPDPSALSYYLAQPVPALAADGLFTVSAVRPVVGENLGFSVAFDYLGSGAPGAQPYERFDANFTLTGSGMTTPALPAVPEPATSTLLLVSLAALALALRRQRAQRR
jgi:hypothetical protein